MTTDNLGSLQKEILAYQTNIYDHLTLLATGKKKDGVLKAGAQPDPYWSPNLHQQLIGSIKSGIPLNLHYVATEYQGADKAKSVHQIHEAKAVIWLQRLLDGKKPPSKKLNDLYGLEELYELCTVPGKQIINNRTDGQILIHDVETTPLFADYAKAQALFEIIEKSSTLNAFADDPSNFLTDNERNQLPNIQSWIESHLKTLQQHTTQEYFDLFVPIAPIPGSPEGFLPKDIHSFAPEFSKVMQRFPLGRLFFGQPTQDVYQTNTNSTVQKVGFWLFSQLNVFAINYWRKQTFNSAKKLYTEAKDLITGEEKFSATAFVMAGLNAMKNTALILFAPVLMISPILHGITSLPFNLIRTILYRNRTDYKFFKLIDALDTIKDIALFFIISGPWWLQAVALIPLPGIIATIGALTAGTLLFVALLVAGDASRFDIDGLISIASTHFMRAFGALTFGTFAFFGATVAIGRALYLGYETVKNYLYPMPEPLLDRDTREDYIRKLQQKASSDATLTDGTRDEIALALRGLLGNTHPTKKTIELAERLLDIRRPSPDPTVGDDDVDVVGIGDDHRAPAFVPHFDSHNEASHHSDHDTTLEPSEPRLRAQGLRA